MNISDKIKNTTKIDKYSIQPSFDGGTLNIELFNGCNEKCIYCMFVAEGMHEKPTIIDRDLFRRVTKEAYELGIKNVGLYVAGEPLINPNIYEYVDYLKNEVGFDYVYLSTNGILCTPKNLVRLVEAGIDSIKFSVSSANRENFYKHHGVDSYEKVLENIKFAYNYRKDNNLDYKLYMFSIITNYNLYEKEDIEKLYSPFVDELIFSNVADGLIKMKGLEEKLAVKDDNILQSELGRNYPCPQLFNRIVIDSEGYLCACCHLWYNLTKVINLKDRSLKSAVYGEEMSNIRKMHLEKRMENSLCNRCLFGIIEEIKPFNSSDNFKSFYGDSIDISEEIVGRFQFSGGK